MEKSRCQKFVALGTLLPSCYQSSDSTTSSQNIEPYDVHAFFSDSLTAGRNPSRRGRYGSHHGGLDRWSGSRHGTRKQSRRRFDHHLVKRRSSAAKNALARCVMVEHLKPHNQSSPRASNPRSSETTLRGGGDGMQVAPAEISTMEKVKRCLTQNNADELKKLEIPLSMMDQKEYLMPYAGGKDVMEWLIAEYCNPYPPGCNSKMAPLIKKALDPFLKGKKSLESGELLLSRYCYKDDSEKLQALTRLYQEDKKVLTEALESPDPEGIPPVYYVIYNYTFNEKESYETLLSYSSVFELTLPFIESGEAEYKPGSKVPAVWFDIIARLDRFAERRGVYNFYFDHCTVGHLCYLKIQHLLIVGETPDEVKKAAVEGLVDKNIVKLLECFVECNNPNSPKCSRIAGVF